MISAIPPLPPDSRARLSFSSLSLLKSPLHFFVFRERESSTSFPFSFFFFLPVLLPPLSSSHSTGTLLRSETFIVARKEGGRAHAL